MSVSRRILPSGRVIIPLLTLGSAASLLAQTSSLDTPNSLLSRGTPTFIVGTSGDDRADRAIGAQAAMIRDLLFPGAQSVDDTAIDVEKGATGWPQNPVVYGGAHVNQLIAKLGDTLPFRIEKGKLTIGADSFVGADFRMIAAVPAHVADQASPGYPPFVIYAGTGSPGVVEINSLRHGADPILVADEFGRLATGRWERTENGRLVGTLNPERAQRIAWRSVDRRLKWGQNEVAVRVRFPKQLPASNDEEQLVRACLRGLQRAAEKINARATSDVIVYVYPDLGSVASLTGKRGDGHAVVESHVVHVARSSPSARGGFEQLIAHEGMHLLAYDTWGAAGTALMGEGLAVWAAEAYGGRTLDEWRRGFQNQVPPLVELLGKGFRDMPEEHSYPVGGVLVEVLMKKVGLEKVSAHLYGATALTWDAACKAAGTTAGEVESALRSALDHRR